MPKILLTLFEIPIQISILLQHRMQYGNIRLDIPCLFPEKLIQKLLESLIDRIDRRFDFLFGTGNIA